MKPDFNPFHLYGQPGCPHCESAALFFKVRGIQPHLIPVLNDPVALKGIETITRANTVPILVSMISPEPEVITGFNEKEYKRVTELYFDSLFRASAVNAPVAQGNDPGQAASVVAVQEPAPEGAAPVPPVSGAVDSGASPDAAKSVQ